MINQKITFPRDDNFSDDELSFLPYFVYFNAIKVQEFRHIVEVCKSVILKSNGTARYRRFGSKLL